MQNTSFDIAVLPGDGIGIEVVAATLPLIEKAARGCGFALRFAEHRAGALHYRDTGEALPEATFEACRDADAILFGAMGWPDIRYPDGTAARSALPARTLCRRAAGARDSRRGAAARLAAGARHRHRPRARKH
jgi:3-isopropylmalate dehydrogenase